MPSTDPLDRALSAIATYAQARADLRRKAIKLLLASTLIAAIIRTSFAIHMPFDIIDQPLHRGYALIFGPFIISAMLIDFCQSTLSALNRRRQVLRSIAKSPTGGEHHTALTPAEVFELRPPLQSDDPAARARLYRFTDLLRALFLLYWPVICFAILLANFLQLRRVNFEGSHTADLLLGVGGWNWHTPKWPFAANLHMPSIQLPIQTWLYLCLAATIIAASTHTLRAVLAAESATNDLPRQDQK